MENQNQLTQNGQELQQQDIAAISANAALADDHVLWELLRLLPGSATPQKVILPFGQSGGRKPFGLSTATSGLVQPNGATGQVRVLPFRALVGSTTLPATSLVESIRGERSGYIVGAGSTQYTALTLAANSSGNPRWDLVYAAVTPNANGASLTRYVKDPTSGVVSATSLVTQLQTTVALGVQQGTPGPSPARPAAPADAGGTYYNPIAYVYVANGFTAGSTVPLAAIHEHVAVAPIHSALGVSNIQPANQSNALPGTVDTRTAGNTLATRPGAYLPSTMIGGESRLIPLQLGLAPVSHNDGDVVDNSVDWRNRFFRWTVYAKPGTTSPNAFASDHALSGNAPSPNGFDFGATVEAFGFGQSFVDDTARLPAGAQANGMGVPFFVDTGTKLTGLGASKTIALFTRTTDGALVLKLSGAPAGQIFIWLEASAPYSNFANL